MSRGTTPQSPLKTMDFKLHQLSASNLASIFNAAYIDAEAPDDANFCVVRGEILLMVWASEEQNIIRFYNQISAPEGMKEEDVRKLVSSFNENISLTKAYLTGRKDDDGDPIIAFEYDYVLLKHNSISPKTLIQLTRMVESSIQASHQIYQQLFAAKT